MSVDTSNDPDLQPSDANVSGGPLGGLPRVDLRRARLDRWIERAGDVSAFLSALIPGPPIAAGRAEILGRAAGLTRPGVRAQLAWSRLDGRVGVGVDTPLAHAMVDRLLGFDRPADEGHRQVTPVEWGILGYLAARALDRLASNDGPLGPWDLAIDKVGPDPFDPRDLGPIVTLAWPLKVNGLAGTVRVWAPASILDRLAEAPIPHTETRPALLGLVSTWRAEAGTITLARGLARLKKGVVLPLGGDSLGGTAASPTGPIALTCRDLEGRCVLDAEAVAGTSGGRLVLTSPIRREPTIREPIAMDPKPPAPTPVDLPITLTVELGRVSLPLARLADLKPGDLIELGRHSREPVELTSNGRLVARGELVQIDTELGLRIINVLI